MVWFLFLFVDEYFFCYFSHLFFFFKNNVDDPVKLTLRTNHINKILCQYKKSANVSVVDRNEIRLSLCKLRFYTVQLLVSFCLKNIEESFFGVFKPVFFLDQGHKTRLSINKEK